MKKFLLATLIIGAFILFSLLYNRSGVPVLLPGNATNAASATRAPSSGGVPTGSGSGSADTPTGTRVPNSLYKDGSYTGSVADAQWGYIQVRAVIQGGAISDVQFLQYPNERERSVLINNAADPQLTSEAIQAQSASVDIVSGATDTSEAFIQSLSD
ncbi:MAG TPA: FMN-binding protein, partial [Ktedonobacteraceae bacterium]